MVSKKNIANSRKGDLEELTILLSKRAVRFPISKEKLAAATAGMRSAIAPIFQAAATSNITTDPFLQTANKWSTKIDDNPFLQAANKDVVKQSPPPDIAKKKATEKNCLLKITDKNTKK